ncbi:MAG: DUF3795 domain-containing protein [Oscillospiraceae bacterium]|nr:DUF3795 domain-containing protein [Oscillospiraceae bacterium]
MPYKIRSYPEFSACGLNCGLCPRYYTDGPSRCPGCGAEGFTEAHCSCSVIGCCERKGLEYCFLCDEYPCNKYEGADLTDSFITHKNQFMNMDKAKAIGIEAYRAEQNAKIQLLEHLLANYDDGRRKSFFCLAVNLFELADGQAILEQLACEVDPAAPIKEKAKAAAGLFQAAADDKGMILKLRK